MDQEYLKTQFEDQVDMNLILMGCDTFGRPTYIYNTYISTEYAETRCLNSSAKS